MDVGGKSLFSRSEVFLLLKFNFLTYINRKILGRQCKLQAQLKRFPAVALYSVMMKKWLYFYFLYTLFSALFVAYLIYVGSYLQNVMNEATSWC